jgi:hypothetical protein
MANDRLYRKDVFLGLAYPEAFANPSLPTAAELNNTSYVIDLTCALVEDNTEFTLGDPETDDTLTFCDDAGAQTRISDNPTIVYSALRDEDRIAAGLYNNAFNHMAFPDIPFYAVERIGLPNTTAFAIGQHVRIVSVKTDQPVDALEKGANAQIQQNFLPAGLVNWNYKITA